MRRRLHLLIPLLVLLLGLALRVWDPVPLREFRYRAFDFFQQIAPRAYDPALPVRIAALDEESLNRYGQWPWPRTLLAQAVENLAAAGAKAIAFDTLFAEPDRSSPIALLAMLPEGSAKAGLNEALAAGLLVDNDIRFARAIAAAPVVLGFPMSSTADAGEPVPQKGGIAFVGESPLAYVWRFAGAVANLPPLEAVARGLGSFSVIKDSDGRIRRIPLILAAGERLYPSLAVEALRVAQGARGITVKVSGSANTADSGAATGVQALRIGKLTVDSVPSGELWLYDSGHQPQRFIPLWQILDGSFDPAEVKDAVVFVGATAAGLFDSHATPLSGAAPGVEQHAQAVEQMLTGTYLQRPLWAEAAELGGVAVVGLLILLCFAIRRLGASWAAVLGVLALAGALGFTWYAFTAWRFLLDPLTPTAIGLVVYAAAAVTSYLYSERQRHQVRAAFGQYVSPAVVARIAERPEQVALGGESRALTVLFCDIRGFTTLSESLDPQTLTRLINRFLTTMSEAVLDSGGTIDKYIGDAMMSFWNAPLDVPEHAAAACATVLEMRARLAELNRALAAEGAAPLKVGIGLNSGPCSVGNMGSAQRLAYTAVGDTVNLASRLEGMTKLYGLDCLVSESTAAAAPEFLFLEVDRIRVKGKLRPVAVFALLGRRGDASAADALLVTAQAAFLTAWRAGDWSEVQACLDRVAGHAGDGPFHGLTACFRQRLQHLSDNPPPPDWDGTFNATEK